MIRISAGSAACMGLTTNKMDVYPTTAYFLSGNSCRMGCAFCPQGNGNNQVLNHLGRVNWPEFSWDKVKEGLFQVEKKGIGRICLQSVRHDVGVYPLLELIAKLKEISNLPVSLSAWIKDQDEATALFKAGVDRISISIDVVDPLNYEQYKGGSMEERLDLLFGCAQRFPGSMVTHLICGLGESEKQALDLINKLSRAGVNVALFAFVPLKGTPLEGSSSPPIVSYRRIQAGYYLLKAKKSASKVFKYDNQGRLVSFGIPKTEFRKQLSSGTAFQTSGCPGCNRPFYNERPGGIIYNYHRDLTEKELETALEMINKSLK